MGDGDPPSSEKAVTPAGHGLVDRAEGRADHRSAQPPACTHLGWGWGVGRKAAGRDPPASPPSRQQMLLPGVSYPGCSRTALGGGGVREEDGGQAHPPRGTHAVDRTRPRSQPRARPPHETRGLWEGGESNTPLDLCCSQGPASRRRSVMRRCCCC